MTNQIIVMTVLLGMVSFAVLTSEFEVKDLKNATAQRHGKFLSFFQVVRFANGPCVGSTRNGTCYTSRECSDNGGVNSGSCAQGFGVCCTFTITCGHNSRENCTYIESNNPTSGECRHTICPCNDNICQLRLDFETFVIAGPSTNSIAETKILAGEVATTGIPNSLASQCLTDSFSVTNTQGRNPAPLCGINSGQHMYVDVDRSMRGMGCNTLDFQLGANAIATTIPMRQWSIKVSQIECDAPWKAPDGCTQYFFHDTGVVQTYNFDGGQHLAFQQQNICVRRARGQCRICWRTMNDMDFALSGMSAKGIIKRSTCCGYSAGGKNSAGFDCLQIPGAMKESDGASLSESRICGRSKGLVDVNIGKAMDVCSRQTPFSITFFSDGFETTVVNEKEAPTKTKGFRLFYEQDSKNCL